MTLTSGDETSSSSSMSGATWETETTGPLDTTSSDLPGAGSESETGDANECGNGRVEGDEECDDGNIDQHDDCLNSCMWAFCGDGKVHDGVENCDDGNNRDDDSCPTTCDFARCGDGFTQLGVEECDDANEDPNDGCDDECVRTRVVFVSSELITGNLGGRAGADQTCQTLAANAELARASTFRAWLSDETGAPALDFHRSPGRYALVTGIPIAEGWDDLTDGSLLNPINVDENGDLVEYGVVTNTSPSGGPVDQAYSCENWSTIEGDTWLGRTTETSHEWTDSEIGNPYICGGALRIYCFEQ